MFELLALICGFISYKFYIMHKQYTNGASKLRKSLSWLFFMCALTFISVLLRMMLGLECYAQTMWTTWVFMLIGVIPFINEII